MNFCTSPENLIEKALTKFAFSIKGKVLEVGPCRGYKTKYLCANKKLKIIGLDNDNNNKKYAKDYKFVLGDGRDMPFENESFDAVASFDVVEHIDDDVLFLRESHRVLKDGGAFCIGTPNKTRLSHKLRKMVGKKVEYPYRIAEGVVHLREYTMPELRLLVEKSGFRIIKEQSMWFGLPSIGGFNRFPNFLEKYAHYLMVFAKK
jgi:SAM-dependent methyltransferase